MHFLKAYETLLTLSQTMATQARDQAWEALTKTELDRSNLVASLPDKGLSSLTPAQQQAAVEIIKQIQNCDQLVLEHVLPWRDSVQTMLTHFEPKA